MTPFTGRIRQTFAAWSVTIWIDQNRLVDLRGHSSKKMIYKVYRQFVEGLELDRLRILFYFVRDFRRGMSPLLLLFFVVGIGIGDMDTITTKQKNSSS